MSNFKRKILTNMYLNITKLRLKLSKIKGLNKPIVIPELPTKDVAYINNN